MIRRHTKPCDHMHVNLKGNDETGLQSISCGDCGRRLTRRFDASGTGYVYELHPDERDDDERENDEVRR